MRKIIALILVLAFAASITACGSAEQDEKEKSKGKTGELTASMTAGTSQPKTPDEAFLQAYGTFAVNLFKETRKSGASFVSPYSAYAALAMVLNGADGQTLSEMLTVLGLSEKDMNEFLLFMAERYNKETVVSVANSVWMNQKYADNIKKSFLQACVDYYRASVFSADFGKQKTLHDMNKWVEEKTLERIHELVDHLEDSTVMILINCLTFDGKWKTPFTEGATREHAFTGRNGTVRNVQMMSGEAEIYYLGQNYEAIEKQYENGFAFRAYLPKEGISIDDLVAGLTAEQLVNPGEYDGKAILFMPKIHYESDPMDLIPPLAAMGMGSAFGTGADFSRMTENCPVMISEVIQKTFLDIDEEGTKAAAATEIGMKCYAAAPEPINHIVTLDRPFLYMIIDETTQTPLFIGVYE